ncbi:MAG: SMP-30/gluconolactonase/LRE family protein, partial [Kangiellaceae bacterium]|nr:SMP-30/gluconolactonase/LRE family protein [Kangiellaceae bacterium]
FWPTTIDPVAWQAPKAPPLTGQFAPNAKLSAVEHLATGEGIGPEDIAIDEAGNLYAGYEDGRIIRFDGKGENPVELANTGGRPLGLDFDPQGNLIIADGYKGLLSLSLQPDTRGELELLTNESNGRPFKFTDDVDVASDGKIYFTDASSKFGPKNKAVDDILEHGGHGRLLRYDPVGKSTSTLLNDLQFANGVALSANEDFVLVAETGSYQVSRYWLKGEKVDQTEIFIDNLPGIPDGISGNGDGTFWLALYSPRNALLDFLSPYPFIRKMTMRLPQFVQPKPEPYAFVLGLDEDGNVTHNLQHAGADSFHPITSAEQHNEFLYLGSLTENRFARYKLTDAETETETET